MTVGSLTLSYEAGPRRFSASVTCPPDFVPISVTLISPAGVSSGMTNTTGGANPSTWQYTVPGSGPVPTGTWTANAVLQQTGTCFGTTTV